MAQELQIELHSRFTVYPSALLDTVAAQCSDIASQIASNTIKDTTMATYHITTGFRTPAGTLQHNQVEVWHTPGTANVAALGQFLKNVPARQADFVKAAYGQLENPDFAELQVVRPGQMGLGFDCWGCLALLVKTLEEDGEGEREVFVYVERREEE